MSEHQEDWEPEDEQPPRLISWEELKRHAPPVSERQRAALDRLMTLQKMLYHLYERRRVSDEWIVQGAGLDGDKYDMIPDNHDDMWLADIGRFVAAMGGHLELRAVFADETVILLSEPGPEHLYDGAS